MKKVTWVGVCLLAGAALAATIAQAQQSPLPQVNLQDQQPGGIGAQPGAPLQQGGPQVQPPAGGIETRQNVIQPQNRFGQQRGFNLQSGIADQPTPAELQAQQPPDAGTMRQGQMGEQRMIAGGQPGELGVWLVASAAGPGVEIRRVTEGSAAAQIGLQPGDVIMEVNGQGASSPQAVAQLIRRIPAGQLATLEVWRDGAQQELQVTLQPMRESYEVGFRGGETAGRSSGDLASRTMRLEEQLSMVMQELQRLRQEVTQLRAGGGQPAESGIDQAATQPGINQFDQNATQPFEQPRATEPESDAAQPEAIPTPATDQPAETTTAPDASSDTTTEPEATEPTPAETETETETDSLFQ